MPGSGTVVITGASTGIGRATALRLARAGFVVLAGVRREEDGAALRAQDGRIEPVLVDVTDAGQIAGLAARVGGAPLAGLVNNAGIAVAGPLEGIPLDLRAPPVRGQRLRAAGRDPGPAANRSAPARGGSSTSARSAGASTRRSSGPTAPRRRPCAASVRRCGASCARGTSASRSSSPARWTPRSGARARRARSETIDALPERVRTLYARPLEALVAATRKIAAGASSPDEAAQAVEHALTAERPRAIYTVGRRARVQGALHSVLPARAFDALVARAMKTVAAPRGCRAASAALHALTAHRGEGRRATVGARVVFLRRVRLGARSARVSRQSLETPKGGGLSWRSL